MEPDAGEHIFDSQEPEPQQARRRAASDQGSVKAKRQRRPAKCDAAACVEALAEIPERAGPATAQEIVDWWPPIAQQVGERGMLLLARLFERGVVLTAGYSGFGFFEVAVVEMAKVSNATSNSLLLCRACDIKKVCREALSAHTCPPLHIFKDTLDRYPKRTVARMQVLHKEYGKKAERERQSSGEPTTKKEKTSTDGLGMEFIDALQHLMESSAVHCEAWCERCKKDCPVNPSAEVTAGHLRVHAAGSTCVDVSTYGSQQRLLGASALPFVAWALERAAVQEDIIFHECTPKHPSMELFTKFLGRSHHVVNFHVCPSQLGWPMTRKRSYTMCISKKLLPELEPVPHPAAYLPGRVVASGEVFFNADKEALQAHCQASRQAAGAGDARYSDLLGEGDRRRLHEWMTFIGSESGASGDAAHIFDVTQSVSFQGRTRTVLPCILQRSRIWCLRKQRYLIGVEAMRAMGWPPGMDDAIQHRPFHELTSAAGNGTHAPTVAARLLSLFTSSAKNSECLAAPKL